MSEPTNKLLAYLKNATTGEFCPDALADLLLDSWLDFTPTTNLSAFDNSEDPQIINWPSTAFGLKAANRCPGDPRLEAERCTHFN